MTTLTLKTSLLTLLLGSALAISLLGCSEDKKATTTTTASSPAPTAAKPNHNPNPFDHSDDLKVTESQKKQFEQAFADQCIERETHNSVNKEEDKVRVGRPCHCIAQFLAKDLTGEEAKKYLVEHEDPQSLRIKYENAAFHCLQQKAPPQEPDFSRPNE